MWLSTDEGREAVLDLSREVVESVAPEEMPIFDQLAEEYLAAPEPPDLDRKARGSATGFGPDSLLIMVTTAAVAVTREVLKYLLEQAGQTVEDVSRSALVDWWREAWDKGPPALKDKQREHVTDLAFEVLVRHGIPPEKAREMINALFVALVRGERPETRTAPEE